MSVGRCRCSSTVRSSHMLLQRVCVFVCQNDLTFIFVHTTPLRASLPLRYRHTQIDSNSMHTSHRVSLSLSSPFAHCHHREHVFRVEHAFTCLGFSTCPLAAPKRKQNNTERKQKRQKKKNIHPLNGMNVCA